MSINNTGFPVLATHQGQVYMIAQNQNPTLGFQYLVPRPFLEASPPAIQLDQSQLQRQQQLQLFHQQQQHIQLQQQQRQQHQQQQQQPSSQPQQQQHSEPKSQPPQPKTKEQTNAEVRNIKERCISHYIEGHLILETSKPLTEKVKTKKKKKEPKKVPIEVQTETRAIEPPRITETKPETRVEVKNELPIRAQMPNWSVAEVVDFIEKHEDIKQYSSKFAEAEIDGQALLLMIDRQSTFEILTSMFKHGPAMKIEATLSKYKINE